MEKYVHGYTVREATRLNDQANALDHLLHDDSLWPAGSLILEAGCGVGSQTKIIAPNNPGSRFISVDISGESLAQARHLAEEQKIINVSFEQADIYHLPYPDGYFDHVFVCFVLEHLPDPSGALRKLRQFLKPSGTIMVIEGDHGSTYFHPDSEEAHEAIRCLVELQKQGGGDANIGRRLYPLLNDSGFKDVKVSPRMVYVDDSKQDLVEGFTKNTFTAMIEGIADKAVDAGIITRQKIRKGISDLYRTASGGGTFCYTFFKGIGVNGE